MTIAEMISDVSRREIGGVRRTIRRSDITVNLTDRTARNPKPAAVTLGLTGPEFCSMISGRGYALYVR
jgi:hypothetical protein